MTEFEWMKEQIFKQAKRIYQLENRKAYIELAVKGETDVTRRIEVKFEEQKREPVKTEKVKEKSVEKPKSKETGDVCPECGGLLVQTGACQSCRNCGYAGGCG